MIQISLGLPFINALYPFLVEHDGITTDPFGQKVKFKFASKTERQGEPIYIYIKLVRKKKRLKKS